MEVLEIFLIALALMGGLMYVAIIFEKRDFNNGVCPHCGKTLVHFSTNSQGGRGYCCSDCEHYIWVSYSCVDKKFKEK